MLRHLTRKALLALPLAWGVVTVVFVLLEIAPGTAADHFLGDNMEPDVRTRVIEQWGLDQPAFTRYGHLLANLATGDLGLSITRQRPVATLIAEALPQTLLLSCLALVAVYGVGGTLGTVQALRRGKAADLAISATTLFFHSTPGFLLAIGLIYVFAQRLGMLPVALTHDDLRAGGMSLLGRLIDRGRHLVLPVATLTLASAAGVARHVRSSMLEVWGQDYIRTAQAKGLPRRTVVIRHALRNALLPIVPMAGVALPFLFSGSVVVEIIFAWPGMGRLIYEAIKRQDTPLVVGCFFVYSLLVVAGNVLADVILAAVDPRIRLR